VKHLHQNAALQKPCTTLTGKVTFCTSGKGCSICSEKFARNADPAAHRVYINRDLTREEAETSVSSPSKWKCSKTQQPSAMQTLLLSITAILTIVTVARFFLLKCVGNIRCYIINACHTSDKLWTQEPVHTPHTASILNTMCSRSLVLSVISLTFYCMNQPPGRVHFEAKSWNNSCS